MLFTSSMIGSNNIQRMLCILSFSVLAGCSAKNVQIKDLANYPTSIQNSVIDSSGSNDESSNSVAIRTAPQKITYKRSVCNGNVPTNWQERSRADQDQWNAQGDFSEVNVESIVNRLVEHSMPAFRPSVFSIADADTELHGATEDPGAEDVNRKELDFLKVTHSNFDAIIQRLNTINLEAYDAEKVTTNIGGMDVVEIRIRDDDPKYGGIALFFFSPEQLNQSDGLIIYNRSPAWPEYQEFRDAVQYFLATMDATACASVLDIP